MSISTALTRDIVASRFLFNMVKGPTYQKTADIGEMKLFAQSDNVDGWALCDGRSLNRVTHSNLFTAIGTAFGNVDSSTFKVPDCRGRVPGMVGSGVGLTTRALGNSLGEETHALNIPEMPSHTHSYAVSDNQSTNVSTTMTLGNENRVNDGVNSGATGATGGFVGATNGQSEPHNNMQPTLFLGNMFIYHGVHREINRIADGPLDIDYMN